MNAVARRGVQPSATSAARSCNMQHVAPYSLLMHHKAGACNCIQRAKAGSRQAKMFQKEHLRQYLSSSTSNRHHELGVRSAVVVTQVLQTITYMPACNSCATAGCVQSLMSVVLVLPAVSQAVTPGELSLDKPIYWMQQHIWVA